jgi:catechol 2,3-dioxygenase
MTLPTTNFDPGFRITRASHIVLTVRDLAASRQFYERVIGLILTAEEGDALYFRGVEEACHHSLVLRKATEAACARIGLRVFAEDDLERLKVFFGARGCAAAWAEVPHQGRTHSAGILRDDAGHAAHDHEIQPPRRRVRAAARPLSDPDTRGSYGL